MNIYTCIYNTYIYNSIINNVFFFFNFVVCEDNYIRNKIYINAHFLP